MIIARRGPLILEKVLGKRHSGGRDNIFEIKTVTKEALETETSPSLGVWHLLSN